MKTQDHSYSDAVKAKVSRESLKDLKTIGDLALEYKVPAYTILNWKKEFMYDLPKVFDEPTEKEESKSYMDKLNAKMDKLEKEKSLYKTNMEKFGF